VNLFVTFSLLLLRAISSLELPTEDLLVFHRRSSVVLVNELICFVYAKASVVKDFSIQLAVHVHGLRIAHRREAWEQIPESG